jgi:hypothetical protein
VDRVYDGLEQVPQAHDDMEHDRATGKLVVRVRIRQQAVLPELGILHEAARTALPAASGAGTRRI